MKEISIKDLYTKKLGTDWVEVVIESITDVFKGEDLETALKFKKNVVEAQQCHWNAGKACMLEFKDYDIDFCEGLYSKFGINHCWNVVTDKRTGEVHYIDFTLGAGEAILLNEWKAEDIMELFDACDNAFIPHRDMCMFRHKNKKSKELYDKYYKVA